MNKSAFVVPLHPKHFNYGYYIINYLYNKKVDLYFIFTNDTEKNYFLSKIININKDNIKYLLLTDFTDIGIVEKTNSFVSIKKLYALYALKDKYDYISCIDSEIQFINNTDDYYNIMKNIVDTKIICGGKLNENDVNEINIVRDSLNRLTDKEYHQSLKYYSQNYRIYTWWSNLPVYDCKISGDFLKWINFRSDNLERFCWNVFDDLLYNYYCILFHNYQLREIKNCFHSLEFADSNIVINVDKTICKIYWVNNNAYCQNKKYFIDNNFIIVYHLDRWKNSQPILLNNKYIDVNNYKIKLNNRKKKVMIF